MKQALVAVTWIAWSVLAASGQTEFEVASVKPATLPANSPQAMLPRDVADRIGFDGGPGSKTPDRINYHGVTLKALLARAYNLEPNLISGPGWLETERYEILAKLPPGTDNDQLRLMLQKLLTERFQIAMHRETKISQVYRLTVAKNGPKLKPAEELPVYNDDAERIAATRARVMASMEAIKAEIARKEELGIKSSGPRRSFGMGRATTAKLAETLSSYLDHPVKDMTGLDGLYSVKLTWVPDNGQPRPADTESGPSIFAAVQEQLGLKLEPAKEQLDLLVIDSVSKVPTSN